jgi:hypothetical protein
VPFFSNSQSACCEPAQKGCLALNNLGRTDTWSILRMVERYAHVDDAELARAVRITAAHRSGHTNGHSDVGDGRTCGSEKVR